MNLSDEHIIIQNIENYNISFYNGNLILTKKKKINKIYLLMILEKSQILSCNINNIKLNLSKYKQILEYIYEYIDNKNHIKDNTILNIEDGNISERVLNI